MQHTVIDLLFRLPDALVLQLASQWLCLKDIANVDSAFSGGEQRTHLLAIFGSAHFTIQGLSRIEDYYLANSFLYWVYSRGISMKTLVVTEKTNRLTCRMYLKKFGHHLEAVVSHGLVHEEVTATELLCLVALYCPNIRSLVCQKCTMSEAIYDVLVNCAQLTHLQLKDYEESSWSIASNVGQLTEGVCSHLETIDIDGINNEDEGRSDSALVVLKLNDPSCVQKLNLRHAEEPVFSFWMSQSTHYSHLTALGLAHIAELTDAHLASIAHCCPSVRHLDVSGCWRLTDDSAMVLARGFPQLRSLGAADDTASDAVLLALSEFRADTLEVLFAQSCPRVTQVGWTAVLRCCRKLHTTAFENGSQWLPTSVDRYLFDNITTLHISFSVSHGYKIFSSLVQCCGNLQRLYLSYVIEWCQLPFHELRLPHLPDLCLLSIHRQHSEYGGATNNVRSPPGYDDLSLLAALQAARPGLCIENPESEVKYEVTKMGV